MRTWIQFICFIIFCHKLYNVYKGKIVLFKLFKAPDFFASFYVFVIYLPTDFIISLVDRHQYKTDFFGKGMSERYRLKKHSETLKNDIPNWAGFP